MPRQTAAVAIALLLMSWVGAACSGDSTVNVNGLTCSSDKFGRMAVDYASFTGSESPLVAVALFVAGSGRGLPASGYEVDNTFVDGLATQETPSSEIYPGESALTPPSTLPMRTQTIVHRSKKGVDVAITVTDDGRGWVATWASYCANILYQ